MFDVCVCDVEIGAYEVAWRFGGMQARDGVLGLFFRDGVFVVCFDDHDLEIMLEFGEVCLHAIIDSWHGDRQ